MFNFSTLKKLGAIALTFGLSLFSIHAFADIPTGDMLQSSQAAVIQNFGSGSTFFKYMIIADIFICGFAYLSTKNLKVFTGVIVFVLIMNVLLGWFVAA